MPTYNESPNRIFARLEAIYESMAETGQLDRFDFFVLSDTTDPVIWLQEEAQFLGLLDRTDSRQIFYRHRAKNTARKSGNIGEWVVRFGGAYQSMVILDADSLMTGDTIVRITAALEQNPHVGLIQTLPMIVNAQSLFARLQQFAGRLYGPMLARGIAWWHGPESNYWGHNAAIRVKAFADHAALAATHRAQAVRRPHPQSRFCRGGADAPRRLGHRHGAEPARQLRGGAAVDRRVCGARPPLVPG